VRPLDPRLLRQARAARTYLVGTVAAGTAVTGLVLAQAALLAHAIAGAFRGLGAGALAATLALLPAVVAARALVAYAGEASALRAAAAVKSQLRRRLVAHVLDLAPGQAAPVPGDVAQGGTRAGEVATLATRGLDALDGYFARYLPQLVLACITPLAVLAVVGGADLLSALVIAVTLPLIPIFMILVGLHTQARTKRQWHLLERLGGHFLDVVEGLPTLKVFGRAKAQAKVIKEVTDAHRRATMATLRVAFLSALVLELLATLAVALVAVEIGLRLLRGGVPYETALLVLLLAPEAYLPLRAVGAQFHASMEGVTAAGRVLDILDVPAPGRGRDHPGPPAAGGDHRTIALAGVTVRYTGRDRPALDRVSLAIGPGERIVVVGPSGAGKSTLLNVLLRFAEPAAGTTSFADVPVAEWRRRIAWVPQHPYLFAGSVADNIRLADPEAGADAVRRAAELAGAAGFIAALPAGYDTPVGERGARLSAGQRQRIALARAFLRNAPLLLLDEPTAHLDATAAAGVRDTVERLMAGRSVVLVTHDAGWTRRADRVVRISAGRLSEVAGEGLVGVAP
jgi:ATP-binding cassette subfamily C protein CydD